MSDSSSPHIWLLLLLERIHNKSHKQSSDSLATCHHESPHLKFACRQVPKLATWERCKEWSILLQVIMLHQLFTVHQFKVKWYTSSAGDLGKKNSGPRLWRWSFTGHFNQYQHPTGKAMSSTEVGLSKAAIALLVECTQTAKEGPSMIPLHSQWVSIRGFTDKTDLLAKRKVPVYK